MSAPKATRDDETPLYRCSIILCGDPGPWAPLHELIEYLKELRDLPNYPEVVHERSAIRGYIHRRKQRPLPWDDFEQFRQRLAAVMSDD
jgi:hypothetical protein